MTLARWKDLCMDAADAPALAEFWGSALGLRLELQDGGDAVLRGGSPDATVWVNRVPEPKQTKNRVHLDLVSADVSPLLLLGARIERTVEDGVRWQVLRDPEGAELCVFDAGDGEPSALVVDSSDPQQLAAWWADVLGAGTAAAPDGTPRWLAEVPGLPYDRWKFVHVDEPKVVKNRLHWDVTCDDVEGLVAAGARVLRRPDDEVSWHVLADPEGNEFCAFGSG